MRDLTPNTAEWHVRNVGILIGNLQSLEFVARSALAIQGGAGHRVDLDAIQPGDVVAEDAITNWDQLGSVLDQFNELAPSDRKLDVQRIVELRDQLAHGRVSASTPTFPLTLLKFGKPASGRVQLLARIEMTETWFASQRALVHEAINTIPVVVPELLRRSNG